MEHVNCLKCGRVFLSVNSRMCQHCRQSEDDDYEKLKKYLEENPLSGIIETSEATGVSSKMILKFLREERLEVTAGLENDRVLVCTRCSEPIKKGIMCDDCKKKYNQEVLGLRREKKEGGTGMHSSRIGDKRRK
jgi:hypothetical protein